MLRNFTEKILYANCIIAKTFMRLFASSFCVIMQHNNKLGHVYVHYVLKAIWCAHKDGILRQINKV